MITIRDSDGGESSETQRSKSEKPFNLTAKYDIVASKEKLEIARKSIYNTLERHYKTNSLMHNDSIYDKMRIENSDTEKVSYQNRLY